MGQCAVFFNYHQGTHRRSSSVPSYGCGCSVVAPAPNARIHHIRFGCLHILLSILIANTLVSFVLCRSRSFMHHSLNAPQRTRRMQVEWNQEWWNPVFDAVEYICMARPAHIGRRATISLLDTRRHVLYEQSRARKWEQEYWLRRVLWGI